MRDMGRARAHIARLENALGIAAQAAEHDLRALPIFDRIEAELKAAKAALASDPIERIRALRELKEQWELAEIE